MRRVLVPFTAFALLLLLIPKPAMGRTVGPESYSATADYALPEAQAGSTYEFHIQTEGGLPPFTWSVVEGELPPGIELHQSGTLRGTPAAARAQAFEFVLRVSDSSAPPQAYTQRFAIDVRPAPLRMKLGAANRLVIVPASNNSAGQSAQQQAASNAGSGSSSSRSAASAGSASASNSPRSTSYDPPILSGELKKGADTVRGFVNPRAESAFVEVFAVSDSGRTTMIYKVPVTLLNITTGEFTQKLPAALKQGQLVRVETTVVENGRVRSIPSDDVTVAAADPPKPADLTVKIKQPLVEGASSISGFVEGEDKATKVIVEVLSGDAPVKKAVTDQISNVGGFSVPLGDEALKVGYTVKARAFKDETPGPESGDFEVESAHDWGRARAMFAFGAMFSKDGGSFSAKDPYLDFQIDYNWYRNRSRTPSPTARSGSRSIQASTTTAQPGDVNVLFNTFTAARLTTIPVKVEGCNDDDFFCSKKAALMQFGAFLPVYSNRLMTWRYNGDRNALFVAPIFKAGIQTVADSNGDSDPNLFKFLAGGFRIGHYDVGRYSDDIGIPSHSAPRMISYLDLTFGKWENIAFEDDPKKHPRRIALEGRLKIPSIPIRVGFDANLGKGKDDLRFIVDTNFDVAELFNKLLKKQ